MTRAAIYARYSSENQRETSIEDQTRLCRERAQREGWAVVAAFSDREISAATPLLQRPGGRAMLQAAGVDFDVLVIEALDRLSRDIVDQERMIRRLEFAGIRIVGTSDGYDSRHEDRALQRGVRGLLNQQYLIDLGRKTHRGQAGQVSRGYNAGGMPYGYRPVRDDDGSRLTVHEPEAQWVRWIFERYGSDGWSLRQVAYALNEQRSPAPRGGAWAISALYGSPAKGTGVLNNPIYIGRYIWNRSTWNKDPDTGKRKRIERPQHEWRTEDRPELRIVSDELWQAVRRRIDMPREQGKKKAGRPASTLFGGILRCGICGGSMVAVDAYAYGCAAAKDRGPTVCAGTTAPRKATDARLLSVVRDDLLSPEAMAAFQADVRELAKQMQRSSQENGPAARQRAAALDAEIVRIVEAIATVGVSPALAERLRAAEAERQRLQKTLRTPAPAESVVRDVLTTYRRMVMQLSSELAGSIGQARKALAEAFGGSIRIRREGEEVYADFPPVAERLLLVAAGGSGAEKSGSGGRIRNFSSIRIK